VKQDHRITRSQAGWKAKMQVYRARPGAAACCVLNALPSSFNHYAWLAVESVALSSSLSVRAIMMMTLVGHDDNGR